MSERRVMSETVAQQAVAPIDGGSAAPPPRILLLSGFLGTGKTTLLKHWLESADPAGRIAVIVNDVAAINIDSRLVKEQTTGAGGAVKTLQLENGCACCSLGDELITSVAELLAPRDGGEPYSRVIVELSGVAEPQRVRALLDDADLFDELPGDDEDMCKVVTLVDSSTFCKDYLEYRRILERPDLNEEGAPEMANCKVVELLVEQVEAADTIVLNKTDLASPDDVAATHAVVTALNDKAHIVETSFGKVPVSAVTGPAPSPEAAAHGEHHHEAEESHAHDHGCHSCSSDGHSHGHESGGQAEAAAAAECHEESHGEAHTHSSACHDPTCTDPSHGHSHSHSDGNKAYSAETTAKERFGITSFCYMAERPFHGARLAEALTRWPEAEEESLREFIEASTQDPPAEFRGSVVSPLSRVIRSKGFCWLANLPSERMYWNHAGKSMDLSRAGVWYGCMSQAQREYVLAVAPEEWESLQENGWSEDFQDRKQEIVFIGQGMDEAGIRQELDNCLLSEEEMPAYLERQRLEAKRLENLSAVPQMSLS